MDEVKHSLELLNLTRIQLARSEMVHPRANPPLRLPAKRHFSVICQDKTRYTAGVPLGHPDGLPVAPRLSGAPGWRQISGVEGRTSPPIGLLSRPNVGRALAGRATNATYCGLLKQPDKQKPFRIPPVK